MLLTDYIPEKSTVNTSIIGDVFVSTNTFLSVRKRFGLKRKIRNYKFRNFLKANLPKMENSCISNLSKQKLTLYELKILNKGLNFVYCDKNKNLEKRNKTQLEEFERKLQIKYYFFNLNKQKDNPNNEIYKNEIEKEPLTSIDRIKIKSHWEPPRPDKDIANFCNKLKYQVKNANTKYENKQNINNKEFKAMLNLRNNDKIIIKAADKGGGIVILNTKDYENKMLTHLKSSNVYEEIPEQPIDMDLIRTNYRKLIKKLKPYTTRKQFKWLNVTDSEPGIIYGLPKIHKLNNPIRPIIAQCKSLTYKLHIYLQQLLKIGETKIPNLIKDTTNFINIINTKYAHDIHDDTLLVTLDVESLYTNIPLELGIQFIIEHYRDTLKDWKKFDIDIKPVPCHILKDLLDFAFRNCYFTFHNTLYRQTQGLTMGGSSSVQAANIIMYKFFKKFSTDNPHLDWIHDRFIDDLFGIWNKSSDELDRYFETLNNYHPNFKFTINKSKTDIPFLDVKILKINDKLQTTLYTKPTDKKLYLNYYSDHPPHVKNAIPFGQFLRIKRIVSDNEDLQTRILDMQKAFLLRDYPNEIIIKSIQRIRSIDRTTLLQYKNKITGNDRPILVLYYENKFIKMLNKILIKLWKEQIQTNDRLNRCFVELPMVAYKNSKTIRNMLISSKYPAPWHNTTTADLDILNLSNLLALMMYS